MGMNKDLLIINSLKPLGQPKYTKQGFKYNCPHCEANGAEIDKRNLEINSDKEIFKCWACNYNGSLYKLIKEKGYKEYLEFFHKDKNDLNFYSKKKYNKLKLPDKLISVFKTDEPLNYLYKRGLKKEDIVKKSIKWCYEGYFKDNFIFPSYDKNNNLNYWVALNLKTGKYQKCDSNPNIFFYEKDIDINLPIILVEGIFDTIGLPNCSPLLGLNINDYTLDFLSNKETITIFDPLADKKLKSKAIYNLKDVCSKHTDFILPAKYKDPNEAFLDDFNYKKELIIYF